MTIDKGKPSIYLSSENMLVSKVSTMLADGQWHHIAVLMPKSSCKLSELKVIVDGNRIQTVMKGSDKNIFLHTSGKLSLGGFGHSNANYEQLYPTFKTFIGSMDTFLMWSKKVDLDDVLLSMKGEEK